MESTLQCKDGTYKQRISSREDNLNAPENMALRRLKHADNELERKPDTARKCGRSCVIAANKQKGTIEKHTKRFPGVQSESTTTSNRAVCNADVKTQGKSPKHTIQTGRSQFYVLQIWLLYLVALVCDIAVAEELLNWRPIKYMYQSANPNDDVPLTPNHFLHGQIGGQFAPESVDTTTFSPMRRWRRVQELVRHFWQRWLREWLPGLNARKKWNRTQKDIAVGDVVLIISPDTQRGQWPLGRVLEVYMGRDGHVRTAKVQTGKTSLLRPITKLCPLKLDTLATEA